MQGKYKVITLCGSTRFKDAFIEAQKRLTLEGNIVISVGLFGHSGDNEVWEGMDEYTLTRTKIMLDDMHKRKIDMADEIYVINVDGYIGESTKSEVAYALEHGKPVRYLVTDEAQEQINKKYVPVENLPISVRLCHILTRNKVDYLYQVESYCEEQLFKFRNMGQSTIDELRAICEQYGIYIYSHRDLSVEEIGVSFAQSYYEKIYGSGIRCIDDVINTSKVELARLFGKNSVTYKKLIQIKDYEEQRKKENALAEKR